MDKRKINNLYLLLRIGDIFVLFAIVMLIFSIIDFASNSSAPQGNFTTMEIADFKEGAVLSGTAVENFGNAITQTTTEYNYGFKGSTYDSAQYYLVPYFDSDDDVVPRKILLIKTGNKDQIRQLNDLTDASYAFYVGEKERIGMSVDIERAVVLKLEKDERTYVENFMHEFIDWFYENSGFDTNKIYNEYMNVLVPYVITYRLASDGTLLLIACIFIVLGTVSTLLAYNNYKKCYAEDPSVANINFQSFGLATFLTRRYAKSHPMPEYIPPTPEEANSGTAVPPYAPPSDNGDK